MKEISSKFPEYLFVMTGNGEEIEDMWDAWFLNGKEQFEEVKFIHGKFDPQKFLN